MFARLRKRLQFALFCILHRRSLAAQQKWQSNHLRRLVQYAYHNVPMWRTVLSEKDIGPDSIRSIGDLSKIPVTDKQAYLGKMLEEYTDNSRPSLTNWFVTSGTSGMPFTFRMSDHARDPAYIDFGSLRFLWWLGEPISRLSSINFARIKIRAPSSEHRLFIPVADFLQNPREILTRIAQFKPEILSTYPSLLVEIARIVENQQMTTRFQVRFVLSIGETLAPSVRQYVSDILKCEIYDRYGFEEVSAVGVECAKHDGFHINTESLIVEIVDESGESLAPGKYGRIVVTDLFNYGMPFIRYDSGDRGTMTYEPCACGLRSPRIWVKGRYSSFLEFPQRRFHHLEFDAAMDGFMNSVLQYQIVKRSDSEICARIVPGPAFDTSFEGKIIESLRKLVGPDIRIAVESVSTLPIVQTGKSRIVADETTSDKTVSRE